MKLWYILGFFVIVPVMGSSQVLNADQIQYLNKEIRFLNESIHRMVIVSQVIENYNGAVTKHVDLPTNEGILNIPTQYPDNVFADNDLVIRGDSPLRIFEQLKEDVRRNSFPVNNWSLIEEGKRIIDFIHKDRKSLDHLITNEDMDIFSNIQTVFKEIEEARDQYDKMRSTVKVFEKLHANAYHDLILPQNQRQVYTAFTELHYDIKKITRQIRNDNQSGVINGVSKLEKEIRWVKTCIAKIDDSEQQIGLLSVATSIEKLIEEIKSYINGEKIPDDYMAYGRGYYFHNLAILSKINQYGSGYVSGLEEFFKKYDWKVINFLEEPHYIKLIYPDLLPLEIMKGDDIPPDQNIRSLPPATLPQIDKIVVEKENSVNSELKTPPKAQEKTEIVEEVEEEEIVYDIVMNQNIRVDSASFDIELFDHYRKDGDRVSINVNGEWVHRKISLEEEMRTIRLSIRPGQANYIIIRADNVGWRTPNTVGIRYSSNSPENTVVIKKDLALGQAIEIIFDR